MKKVFILMLCLVMNISVHLYCEEAVNNTSTSEKEKVDVVAEEVKPEVEKYILVYKFPKETEIYYQISLDKKDNFNIGGRKFDVNKRTLVYISELFQGVDENKNGIITITCLQGWQDNIKIFSQPKEVKIKMSPKGEILESQGFQDISAEFLKVFLYNLADYIPGIDRLPIKIDLSKMPSNEFNIYFQAFIFPVPGSPVAVGDVWEKRDKNMGVTIQYKLQEIKEGKAYIDISTENNRGSLEGKVIFDIENGYLISNYVKMSTDATGKIVQKAAKEIGGVVGTEVKPSSTLPERTQITFKMEFVPMEE
ncbi:MAG: DUF6263 family protein [Candidatus Ratteibacteria bacterium]|nr:DUF6263 family protein [Candidatus Ratteibacteria bacterium]